MGGKKITVEKVAPVIAKFVKSIEEVHFSLTVPNSLTAKIAQKLKVAYDKALYKKLMYLWQKGGLYPAMVKILQGNNSINNLVYNEGSVEGKVHAPCDQSVSLTLTTNESGKRCEHGSIVNVEDSKFRIVNVVGDGNCLFRCFAYYLFGNEHSHDVVRRAIVEYVILNWTDEVAMLNSTCEEQTFKNESHYRDVMGSTSTYGTDFEVSIFARLYKVNLTIYREQSHDRDIIKVQSLPCAEKGKRNYLNIMFTGNQRSGHWVVLEAINDLAETQCNEHRDVVEPEVDTEFPGLFLTSTPCTNSVSANVGLGETDEPETITYVEKIATSGQEDVSSMKDASPFIEDENENVCEFMNVKSPSDLDTKTAVANVGYSSRHTRRKCYETPLVPCIKDKDDVYTYPCSSSEALDSHSSDTTSVCSISRSRKRTSVPTIDTDEEQFVDDEDLSIPNNKLKENAKSKKEKKNDSEIKKKGKTKEICYNKDLGTVDVASTELKTTDGALNSDRIRRALVILMETVFKSSCILRFRHIRPNHRDLVVYAKCKQTNCEQPFRFRIHHMEKPISEVIISSNRKITVVHKKKEWAEIFKPLRGESRVEALMKMQNRRPIDYLDELQLSTNAALMEDGNNQRLCKLNTLYKIKSEERCKDRLSLKSDDLSDLMELQVQHSHMKDPFLRRAGTPLHAYMYTVEDLYAVKQEKDKNGHLIGNMDATGSLVRKPQYLDCKRIFYYAFVIKLEKEIIFLAQLITAEHGVLSIGAFLREYRLFVERELKRWPLVDAMIVDWSWALIKSILEAWNRMTVSEYLDVFFECCIRGEHFPKAKVLLKICYGHFMKNVSKTIHDKYPEYKHFKQLLLECMSLLCLSRSLNEATMIFEHMCTLLLSAQAEKDSLAVIRNLTNKNARQTKNMTDYDDLEVDEDLYSIDSHKDDTVYRNSPFYKKFNKIIVLRQANIERQESKNTMNGVKTAPNMYYAPKFVEYVVKQWMPYLVLWTAIGLDAVDPNISRLSNAYSEASNKVVKEVVFEGRTKVSIADCVRKLNTRRQRTIAIINLDANVKGTNKSSKKSKFPQAVDDPDVEEMWQRKKSRKRSNDGYARGTMLKKLCSRLEQEQKDRNEDEEIENVQERIENFDTQIEHFEEGIEKSISESKDRGLTSKLIEIENTENSESNKVVVSKIKEVIGTPSECDELEKFYNGLVKSLDYWKRSKSNLLTVCRYITNKSLTVQTFEMTVSQFTSLLPPQWIDGIVIDAFIASSIDDWDDVMFVPTDDTSVVLGDFSERRTKTKRAIHKLKNKSIGRKLFMPYVYMGHWRLLVADVQQEHLTLLDPYETSTDKDRAFEAFKNFLRCCEVGTLFSNLKNVIWKEYDKYKERPYQPIDDGSSCGAYVMYYAECLGNEKPFDTNFDPVAYRLQTAHNLLLKSEDMAEVCLHCWAAIGTDIAKCKMCERKSHKNCVLKSELNTDDEEEFVKKSCKRKLKSNEDVPDYFVCRLCGHRRE